MDLPNTDPPVLVIPFTSSVVRGDVVPIPTLPFSDIVILASDKVALVPPDWGPLSIWTFP